ncbi:hypothetical protein [Mucilaginibacter pedocola]|uniref:Uncharacterized protein n=1 Tax=Mucilaginibacter pedocola TaxID=1792845 RepID=A0A1S9PBH0_9SPHI|nr:hypothetical protein [Mucilaginibacter pedocola]OOQ58269.1 hypothetical protein BC343_11585 [Mucilaginibacter pedocola]
MIPAELFKLLNSEIEKELDSIESDIGASKAIKLLELAKCTDHCFVAVSFIMPKESAEYQSWADLFQQFSTGWYVSLRLTLEEQQSFVSILNVNSRQKEIGWANKIMQRCGDAGNLIKLFSLANTNDFVEAEQPEEYTVLFRFSGQSLGIEHLETQRQKWFAESLLSREETGYDFEKVIIPLVKAGVSSPDGQRIIYKPDKTVDHFFFEEGKIYSQALIGSDSFNDNSNFGGIPFDSYKSVMSVLIGNAFRHLHYCFAYQGKTGYKVINPWNTYTRILEIAQITELICKQTSLPDLVVNTILEAIILDKKGLNKVGFAPGYAPPPLIRISEKRVISSMMGHLSNPMAYLSRCLVKKFPDDYSIAVNLREQKFKTELYSLFGENLFKVKGNVTIRKDKKLLTDIDAIISDEKSRIVFLFQLKWMDDWGSDMGQRSSMFKNYTKSVAKWLEVVDRHISAKSVLTFLKNAGIKKPYADTVIVKIVLGRHFSRFSNISPPDDTFFLNWASLVKIITENPQCGLSLSSLNDHLKNNQLSEELAANPPATKDVKLRLGPYTIITESFARN